MRLVLLALLLVLAAATPAPAQLDGLFLVVGQEEQKIRTNPAARVTDLLKDVFGR